MTGFSIYIIWNESNMFAWIFLNINVYYHWEFAVTVDHLVDQMVVKQQNNVSGW
jgi:hypothetical protein